MAITLTCDHCGETSFTYRDADDVVMWCGSCITADYKMIDQLGLIHNAGDNAHFIWVSPKSLILMRALPKKAVISVPLTATITGKPFDTEKKPCSRAYYGMPDCTCGKCPPKRHPINTNPFRYGF